LDAARAALWRLKHPARFAAEAALWTTTHRGPSHRDFALAWAFMQPTNRAASGGGCDEVDAARLQRRAALARKWANQRGGHDDAPLLGHPPHVLRFALAPGGGLAAHALPWVQAGGPAREAAAADFTRAALQRGAAAWDYMCGFGQLRLVASHAAKKLVAGVCAEPIKGTNEAAVASTATAELEDGPSSAAASETAAFVCLDAAAALALQQWQLGQKGAALGDTPKRLLWAWESIHREGRFRAAQAQRWAASAGLWVDRAEVSIARTAALHFSEALEVALDVDDGLRLLLAEAARNAMLAAGGGAASSPADFRAARRVVESDRLAFLAHHADAAASRRAEHAAQRASAFAARFGNDGDAGCSGGGGFKGADASAAAAITAAALRALELHGCSGMAAGNGAALSIDQLRSLGDVWAGGAERAARRIALNGHGSDGLVVELLEAAAWGRTQLGREALIHAMRKKDEALASETAAMAAVVVARASKPPLLKPAFQQPPSGSHATVDGATRGAKGYLADEAQDRRKACLIPKSVTRDFFAALNERRNERRQSPRQSDATHA
jgi:hypothetical protein